MARDFRETLDNKWCEKKFVCVGLDSSDVNRMCAIVDATHDFVGAYKPNSEFYLAQGPAGLEGLRAVIGHIHQVAPGVPVILDRKAGDIGTTNLGTVQMAFDFLQADAITVHPYVGAEALQPFLSRKDRGIFVLCRTSNPGAGEFQDLLVNGEPLYRVVARRVANEWNKNGNCAVVVGATYPDELGEVRQIVGDMPILIPGIGAQGGDLEASVRAAGGNMIINSSRGIIFASRGSDFAEAARTATLKLHKQIQTALVGTS